MIKPTNERPGRAYPPRERWVIDAAAFTARLSDRAIAHRRLEHHGPTSHEVGMPAVRATLPCRLEHHGPTSHEVGMRENLTRTSPGQSMLDCPYPAWYLPTSPSSLAVDN
jgi:hypothetical protein